MSAHVIIGGIPFSAANHNLTSRIKEMRTYNPEPPCRIDRCVGIDNSHYRITCGLYAQCKRKLLARKVARTIRSICQVQVTVAAYQWGNRLFSGLALAFIYHNNFKWRRVVLFQKLRQKT
jgi:hypothetical protein